MKPLHSFRAEFPVSRTHIFLNHGGVSPTSTRVVDAVHAFMDSRARVGRPSFDDWESLATDCRERGVLLCVDGIQTVGALPLDVKAAGIHFLSADSHKWMLGMMGIGAVFVDRSVVGHIHPALIGGAPPTTSTSTASTMSCCRMPAALKREAWRIRSSRGSLRRWSCSRRPVSRGSRPMCAVW